MAASFSLSLSLGGRGTEGRIFAAGISDGGPALGLPSVTRSGTNGRTDKGARGAPRCPVHHAGRQNKPPAGDARAIERICAKHTVFGDIINVKGERFTSSKQGLGDR